MNALDHANGIPVAFSEEWLPERLLVRDKQLTEIQERLKQRRHIFLAGDKATGKTTTCKFFEATSNLRTLYVRVDNTRPEAHCFAGQPPLRGGEECRISNTRISSEKSVRGDK